MSQDRALHDQCFDALGAYVLRALPDEEHVAVERHLEDCAVCRRDASELQLVADALSASPSPVEPSRALRDRVMAVVQAEADVLHAAGPAADRAPAPRRRRMRALFPRPALTAGAAAAALAAGLAGGIIVVGDGDSGPSRPASRLVAARITDRDIAARAHAAVRVSGNRASLLVHGLPDPPSRRVYQLWLKEPGRSPVPAGATFAIRSGTVEIPRSLHGGEVVMVTSEPPGGSPAPTRPPLIVTRPA